MKFTLVRNIYFNSQSTGLVSKYVAKDVESEVSPQVGFEFEDSAWHRDDPIRAESISIDSDTGKCTVTLNSRELGAASDVEKLFKVAVQLHGWKDWLSR
ncbi:hypothetical protein PQU63_11180 [Xanthomonas protegens]|uniref:Uncharacterized protein n=1 Tax=Xanthomonas protegens TaxID=3380705 RepID=A0ABU9LE83_9XANT